MKFIFLGISILSVEVAWQGLFLCLGSDAAPVDPVPPVGMAVRRDQDGDADGQRDCFLWVRGAAVGCGAGVDVALDGAWVSDGVVVTGVPVGLIPGSSQGWRPV